MFFNKKNITDSLLSKDFIPIIFVIFGFIFYMNPYGFLFLILSGLLLYLIINALGFDYKDLISNSIYVYTNIICIIYIPLLLLIIGQLFINYGNSELFDICINLYLLLVSSIFIFLILIRLILLFIKLYLTKDIKEFKKNLLYLIVCICFLF